MAGILAGKTVFVTGGSGGIGRALCVRFASLGATVGFSYFSDHEKADATVAAMKAAGSAEPKVFRANLKEEKGIAELAAEVVAAFPAIDIFVSNAATGVLRNTAELTGKHFDWTIGVNAKAFLLLTNAFLPTMPAGSRILALSSAGATHAIPLYAAIGASKAALESLVRHYAVELAARDITVNAIAPGIVETGALEYFPHKDELIDVAKRKTPSHRLCTPEDVADVAELLVSPKAKFVTGQTLVVDGGYSIVG